ncbi:MAG: T9SS type A sorting domain-containing protein [Rhodothermales bacterium]|nr:T9SS type A sorting domain-containing protein [Rhodothermales bacterium]MBO6779701.1 T9SS type A sorting domain-containing protein [Rhodothermales bacterium]
MYAAPAAPGADEFSDDLLAFWRVGAALLAGFVLWFAAFGNTERAGMARMAGLTQAPSPGPAFVMPLPSPLEQHASAHTATAGDSPDDIYWQDGFAFPYAGVSGDVHAVVPDGSGGFYAGGAFEFAGGTRVGNVARWDAESRSWHALGTGTNSVVTSLALDPYGRLYAGGAFTEVDALPAVGIARWDPVSQSWAGLGASPNQAVDALATLPDGRIAAGGVFTRFGAQEARGVAVYDPLGDSWTGLGAGLEGHVRELAVSPAGVLVASGRLEAHGHIARWEGGAWQPYGDGAPGPVEAVAFDGSRMIIGGRFESGPIPNERILGWDEGSGTFETVAEGLNANVDDLVVLPDGRIAVSGAFSRAGAIDARGLALFDGDWLEGPQANSRVRTLAQLSAGGLVAGGAFTEVSQSHADGLVAWTPGVEAGAFLESDGGNGTDGAIFDLLAAPEGVYAGGVFLRVAGENASAVARWNPESQDWEHLGDGLDNLVKALARTPNGDVFAGGYFTASGQTPLRFVARWDGTDWRPLGAGVNGAVEDLAVDGAGRLVVGGYFSQAGQELAPGVAIWDPATESWSSVGTTMNAGVDAVAIGLDGTIYAGGSFTTADGVGAAGIARWKPGATSWEPLGLGKNSIVRALVVAEDGDLYAGGIFTRAGTVAADYAARWDIDQEMWHPLSTGLNSAVRSLARGPAGTVLAGGVFTHAEGREAPHVAVWDPADRSWSALGSGTNASVRGMALAESGEIYLGGFFTRAGGVTSSHFAVFDRGSTGTASEDPAETPSHVTLHQNYPNPFNPVTTIRFETAISGDARLAVYDLLGREVSLLMDGPIEAGRHAVTFDARALPSGAYMYRLSTADGTVSRTMTLMK